MAVFLYDTDIADEIIDRVSEGETLNKVCNYEIGGLKREPGEFPRPYTVYQWCNVSSNTYQPEFCERFSLARFAQQSVWVEEMIDIADTPEMGEETTTVEESGSNAQGGFDKERTTTTKKEMYSHRALRINTRARAVAMFNPELWGGKLKRAGDDNDRDNEVRVHGGLYD